MNDREVDLNLIEPTGMNRRMDQKEIRPLRTQAISRLLAPMCRAVIHNPEDAAGGLVGLLAHHLTDKAVDWSNPGLGFATAEDFGAMDIPGCKVGPGSFTKVLVLNSHGSIGSHWQSRLFAAARLDASLLVCRNHKVIRSQWNSLPNPTIQVKDKTSFNRKVRIARENPTPVLPRSKGIAGEPAP